MLLEREFGGLYSEENDSVLSRVVCYSKEYQITTQPFQDGVLSRVVCYSNGDCTRLLKWALEVLSRVVCYSNSSAEMIAVSVKHGFNSGSVLLERYRDQIRSFIYGSFKSSRVLLEPR